MSQPDLPNVPADFPNPAGTPIDAPGVGAQQPTELERCLRKVVEVGGSDLHLREDEPPFIRRNGGLRPLPDSAVLTRDALQEMLVQLCSRVPHRMEEFERNGEADLSYELAGVARFRVNIFRERGRLAATLRVIPQEVPQIGEIKVPDSVRELSLEHHGLILVTGATGSGKTTTLAAMIDNMNRETERHILTIEDPIEIMHPNHRSLISQREVGSDTGDFQQALRRALRQDPDVILIGEIRDEETMRTALAAAETGHLVLATLHTIDAAETIARVLDLFPAEGEKQARAMLAGALKGIISQRLARTLDDKRVPIVEVLINTSRIADCITNPEETGKLNEAIAAGEYYGMQTFDQALIRLIMNKVISETEALRHVSSPQNFKLALESAAAQAAHDQKVEAAQEAAAAQALAEAQAQQAMLAQQQNAMQYGAPAPVPGAAPAIPGYPAQPQPSPAQGAPMMPSAAPPAAPAMPAAPMQAYGDPGAEAAPAAYAPPDATWQQPADAAVPPGYAPAPVPQAPPAP